jgi:hypothetical protein
VQPRLLPFHTSGDTSSSSIIDNYLLIGLDHRIPTYPQHKRQRASERERRSSRDRVDQLKRDTTLGKSDFAVNPIPRPRDRDMEGEKRLKVLASWASRRLSWMNAFELATSATRTTNVSFGERGQSGFRWTDLVEGDGSGRAFGCFPLIEKGKKGQ